MTDNDLFRQQRHGSHIRRVPMRKKTLVNAIVQAIAAWTLSSTSMVQAGSAALALPQPEAVLATMGIATYNINGLQGIVDQKSDRAILNWKSFDIGAQNSVEFRQPSSTSIALNRINERTNPSKILGQLTANGQIYLYNPNGFVFGNGAQVNVNSLVASTLNISDAVFERGISSAITDGTPAFSGGGEIYLRDEAGNFQLDAQGQRIKIGVTVESGASLNTNAANGRILVFAPSILNSGEINSQQGQVILAAATDKVYLQAADAASTGVRGLLVEVSTGGDVTNLGKITANKGNVTLLGFAVNQNGIVSATTSVNLNGSIILKASENAYLDNSGAAIKLAPGSTARQVAGDDGLGTVGTVTLGVNSTTQVALDNDGATAVDEQAQDPSRIDIVGNSVHLQNGAVIRAPGGRVGIVATEYPRDPASETVATAGTGIKLEAGSIIDVAGADATAPVERNIVTVQLLSNELRDAPEQKNGPLFGQKIQVDIRTGTPLADISGVTARIQRGVAERNSAGGTINLQSAGSVDIGKDSLLDVSGGLLQYTSGYINTTQLLGVDGKIYDISQADPQRQYIGVLGQISKNYQKWNVTKTWDRSSVFSSGRFEAGYVEGKAGGTLSISSPQISLQGNLRGNTVDGAHQLDGNRAAGATLVIDQSNYANGQNIVIGNDDTAALLEGLNSTIALVDERLERSGFRNITLQTNKHVDIAADSTLTLDGGSALNIVAGSSTIAGRIDIASGSVNVKTTGGDLVVGNAGSIDVSGSWYNDQLGTAQAQVGTQPHYLDGGSVTLAVQKITADEANKNAGLILSAGSKVNVDGGAWLQSQGAVTDGKAGSIALRADARDGDANIVLQGQLSGSGLKSGGALSITTNRIDIANAGTALSNFDPAGLLLTPDFFLQGGFSSYRIAADRDGLQVHSGAVVHPRNENWQLNDDYRLTASARGIDNAAHKVLLSDELRAPASITLVSERTAPQANLDAALVVDAGSRIETDTAGKVALASDANLTVNGVLSARAGTIDLRITTPPQKDIFGVDISGTFADKFYPDRALWIGSGALLDASGIANYVASASGLKIGAVLAGGSVNLNAASGYVAVEKGASIDVSGASGIYSQAQIAPQKVGTVYTDSVRASDGGSIQIAAADGALLQGTLSAHAGAGANAGGGTLGITLLGSKPVDINNPAVVPNVIQVGALPSSTIFTPKSAADAASGIPSTQHGLAYISARQIQDGGFAALDLSVKPAAGNAIEFDNSVALQLAKRIALDTPALRFAATDSNAGLVSLQAAYVALGSTQSQTAAAVDSGSADLKVYAQLIDLIGGLGIGGARSVALQSDGDIRLRGFLVDGNTLSGELKTSADILFKADQLYPTTLANYQISLIPNPQTNNTQGTITVAANGAPHPVLSAAGSVVLNARNIVQQGVIKAPFGSIALNASENLTLANGSITSVSGENQIIPFGETLAGLQWAYDFTLDPTLGGYKPLQASAPQKNISLSGKSVQLASGAVLDISGGGDLQAYEFIRGPGGSADVLDPTDSAYTSSNPYTQKFAVLPTLQGQFAPFDYTEFTKSGLEVGSSIYLSGGGGLAAGTYVLLPARYALLPGAFLVTPQASKIDVVPGSSSIAISGSAVASGYRLDAGTAIRDSSWSNFVIEPGTVARTRSEYTLTRASAFFKSSTGSALQLPDDAGAIAIAAQTQLQLQGAIASAPAHGGRSGQLDIAGNNIAIVARDAAAATESADQIVLVDDDLNKLGVDDILIGGLRTQSDTTTLLSVTAQTVEVAKNAVLTLPELWLAAKEKLTIGADALLQATPAANSTQVQTSRSVTVDGDAALMRIANRGQIDLHHTGTIAGTANLTVAQGATLQSNGAIAIDSTGNAAFNGVLKMHGGDLAIGAQHIVLGDAPNATGFVLRSATLNNLDADAVTLNSNSQIDLYGDLELAFKQLTVSAAGLQAVGAGARSIDADTLLLDNSESSVVANSNVSLSSGGQLHLQSKNTTLGAGQFSLLGFDAIDLAASQSVRLQDSGKLWSAGTTVINTPTLLSAAGANYAISTAAAGNSFYDFTLRADNAATTSALALGGRLSIDARNIAIGDGASAVSILLPAGSATLNAHGGDVVVANGATLDVSGRQTLFADKLAFAPAGSVAIGSDSGSIQLASGSKIDLSGAAQGGDAGALSLSAPLGSVTFGGQLIAQADAAYSSGSLTIDSDNLAGQSLSSLLDLFDSANFHQAFSLRQRSGDLRVGATDRIRAHSIALTADRGQLIVDGQLDASGVAGGRVALASGNDFTLSSSGRIFARASGDNEKGGKVSIDSVGGVGSGGALNLQSGSSIDVTGGRVVELRDVTAGGTSIYGIDGPQVTLGGEQHRGGEINLRAPRTANSLRANSAGTLAGVEYATAEAVRIYDLGTDGIIDAGKIAAYKNDTATFMNGAVALGGNFVLTPGIEIRAANSLSLNAAWDLVGWRYNNVPGVLTLRSGGALNINAALSDAFKAQVLRLPNGVGGTFTLNLKNALQEGDSWSYRLIGGGDLASAAVEATNDNGIGSVTLASAAYVRTGTGSIDVAAAGDVKLTDDLAAIYTVGKKLPASNTLDENNPYGTLGLLLKQFYAEFPVDGGDIRINAQGNIIGATQSTSSYFSGTTTATTHQFITDWWAKAGTSLGYTAWGIELDIPTDISGANLIANTVNARSGFRQNIGALGGGNIDIVAGGAINDLSVMLPTTGKPVGQRQAGGTAAAPVFTSRDILINGGGNLTLRAGGDIAGGMIFVDRGSASIFAGGDLTGGSQYTSGTVFALGDATLNIIARGALEVGAVFDPGLLTSAYSTRAQTYFSTYTERSAVDLTAISGAVVLQNDISVLEQNAIKYTLNASTQSVTETQYLAQRDQSYTGMLTLYPSLVNATALSGDIDVMRRMTLSPSPFGNLNLLALQNIQSGDLFGGADGFDIQLTLSDADIANFPNRFHPGGLDGLDGLLLFNSGSSGLSHAVVPVHTLDSEPARIIALNGDILGNGHGFRIDLAKPAIIQAGRDIVDVGFDLQNINASDVTLIQAGRDIRYSIDFNPLSGAVNDLTKKIDLSGPGRFEFLAGRTLDLGASVGVDAVGNKYNPALSNTSASVGIYAGFAPGADYTAFIQNYLTNSTAYDKALSVYIAAFVATPLTSKAEQLAAFEALPLQQQRKLLTDIFFDELRGSGVAAAEQGRTFYQRGLDAIKTLFPQTGYSGDVKLFFSKIYSEAGGDVDIVVPGGLVNAGLASAALKIDKSSSDLGIVSQGGDVNIFVDGDLQVNQSKVFAVGGGNITVWSTHGNIDAGRGSKAALSAPPPTFSFDEKGNLVVVFPPLLSGSGIRAASAGADSKPGDVYLFAVNGVIDAGEAGIGGTNIVLAANAVIGAQNIDVGGTAVGIPTATVSIAAGLTGIGNQDSAVSQAASNSVGNKDNTQQSSVQMAPSLLTAQVVGFGDYSVGAIREGNFNAGETDSETHSGADKKERDKGKSSIN